MCGIAGYLAPEALDQASLRAPVARMCERMVHRGPDMSGLAVDGPACLGHRRLSIIDLSSEGAQPMANEDETIQVVVNGEIYNFAPSSKARVTTFVPIPIPRSPCTFTKSWAQPSSNAYAACLHSPSGTAGNTSWCWLATR